MKTDHLLIAAALLVLTAISFFWFPGHTILLSDTQIYLPILEHLWDPSVLAKDPMAARPHVTYTIYDEVALVLRRVTGLGFEPIVLAQQFAYRALGILGLFLIATSLRIPGVFAMLLAALVSVGATVNGPAVLTVEYEPVPRGFAMPFILLSMGAAAHGRWVAGGVAAAIGFLFHPPTALAYCGLFVAAALWTRQWRGMLPLILAAIFMLMLVIVPELPAEGQAVLSRIEPELERIQRWRANYNWVSIWLKLWLGQYLLLSAFSAVALWRVWSLCSPPLRIFFIGLPAAGMLSLPVSHWVLEDAKWMLAVQFQPGRYLVFVTLSAMILCAAAGLAAALNRRWAEAFTFLLVAVAIPIKSRLFNADMLRLGAAAGVAASAVLAVWMAQQWTRFIVVLPVVAMYSVVPNLAIDGNRPEVHSADLDQLAAWARQSTPRDAVFFFPGAGRSLEPGIFRERALRAVYVDWKSGGQVNFLKSFAYIWRDRWTQANRIRSIEEYRNFGIDYIVLAADIPVLPRPPAYQNPRFTVYALKDPPRARASIP